MNDSGQRRCLPYPAMWPRCQRGVWLSMGETSHGTALLRSPSAAARLSRLCPGANQLLSARVRRGLLPALVAFRGGRGFRVPRLWTAAASPVPGGPDAAFCLRGLEWRARVSESLSGALVSLTKKSRAGPPERCFDSSTLRRTRAL